MKQVYICDPEKNKECSKTTCIHNPEAKYRDCELTLHRGYAKVGIDGLPIRFEEEIEDGVRKKQVNIRRDIPCTNHSGW